MPEARERNSKTKSDDDDKDDIGEEQEPTTKRSRTVHLMKKLVAAATATKATDLRYTVERTCCQVILREASKGGGVKCTSLKWGEGRSTKNEQEATSAVAKWVAAQKKKAGK